MITKQTRAVLVLGFVSYLIGCSSEKGMSNAGAGGGANATGGAAAGGSASGGTSSSMLASGGALESGGASAATGGTQQSTSATTGGRATGGTHAISGGTYAVDGTSPVSGASATGGRSASTGGTTDSGGTGAATGGAPGSGGAAGTGGTVPVDPNASAAISACIDKLPYGGKDLGAAEREPIIKAIINTCVEFAPPGPEWQTHCQMFLVGAINSESSFNTQAGAQGAGNDPSVGLMQIRFGATVRDFVDYGPIDAMARIGCDFGTVTSGDSYATKSAMMLDVNCNIALATWYIFTFGSGNGGANVVWVYQYCAGRGVAGNLHIGLASYLMGAEAAHSSLSGADFYYNQIKSWFDPCVTYSGTHPFELPIEPDNGKYCG